MVREEGGDPYTAEDVTAFMKSKTTADGRPAQGSIPGQYHPNHREVMVNSSGNGWTNSENYGSELMDRGHVKIMNSSNGEPVLVIKNDGKIATPQSPD